MYPEYILLIHLSLHHLLSTDFYTFCCFEANGSSAMVFSNDLVLPLCSWQSPEDGHRSAHDVSPGDSDDQEMVDELVQTVTGEKQDDMLSAYDVDVSEDGEAIQMYLSLLESAQGVAGSS